MKRPYPYQGGLGEFLPYQGGLGGIEPGGCRGDVNEANDEIPRSIDNLAAGRYKPRVAEAVPDEDPALLIRGVLEIEREIALGLEKLWREIE